MEIIKSRLKNRLGAIDYIDFVYYIDYIHATSSIGDHIYYHYLIKYLYVFKDNLINNISMLEKLIKSNSNENIILAISILENIQIDENIRE